MAASEPQTARLRLVKVVCQAHFVLEDADGDLTEQVTQPVEVAAKDWPTYPDGEFATAVEQLQAQLSGAVE